MTSTLTRAGEGPKTSSDTGRFRGRRIAAIVVVMIAVAGALSAVAWADNRSADGALSYGVGCRGPALSHVAHPSSYHVAVACARIRGTVQGYRFSQAYDDLKLTVVPDSQYRSTLRAANEGRFVVDIIAADLSAVKSPHVGSDDTFYGSWVEDRGSHSMMLLPTWRIDASPGPGVDPDTVLFGAAASRHAGQTLLLSPDLSTALSPGVGLTIPVRAVWRRPHAVASSPASQVRVLAEISVPSGRGIAWKGAQTSTLGTATVRLAFILAPGRYRYELYAVAAGLVTSVSGSFVVRGRE